MPDLLFLAHRIPYPPNKGDKLRSYHILKYLSERYRVHLGCFIDERADRKYVGKVAALCHQTCFIDLAALPARVRSLRGFLTGEALSLPYYRNARLGNWVARLLVEQPVRAALAFSAPMAQYLIGAPALRRVIDFVDVDSEKWRQYAQTRAWPLSLVYRREAEHLLAFERAVAARFERSTFVSSAEAALFTSLAPESRRKIAFFNNGVDADYFSPHILYRNPYPAGSRVLVFTGAMDYWPNVEAVEWFARAVFAPLHAQTPALLFYIVGTRPSPQVQALGRRPGIVVTGAVPDTRPYLAHASLAVAPLRIARGVQNKVLEAMAMQKTVIVSPQALEGIGALPGSELLVAGDGAEFIAQIQAALSARSTRHMGQAARARVVRDYSWDHNLARLSDILAMGQGAMTDCKP